MDIETKRYLMIEQQIRPWNVLERCILDLLPLVKRELFVAADQTGLAFVDTELPLPCGQSMLSPKVEARMLQSLALKATDDVLEVGAGSGYMAALMAHQCRHVTSAEIHPEVAAVARANLKAAGVANVQVVEGDGLRGVGQQEFDVIVISGSVQQLPQALLARLKPNGRLLAIVGKLPMMECVLVQRAGTGFSTQHQFETVAPEMVNGPKVAEFTF